MAPIPLAVTPVCTTSPLVSAFRVQHNIVIWMSQRSIERRTNSITATENLNQWYQPGDQAYILVSSAMVLLMVPGLGFLYSGLARRKSALSMIYACLGSYSVICFQWYFWGYSLAFSNTATNGFIGNLRKFGLMNTLATPDTYSRPPLRFLPDAVLRRHGRNCRRRRR
jgi:hypothetical protein